ncbi:hypothetical protein TNCV_4335771 [Trichonephila clavipes]|nr:hypothetical protein TNCV_4335771 [Trichonephila clavipes]
MDQQVTVLFTDEYFPRTEESDYNGTICAYIISSLMSISREQKSPFPMDQQVTVHFTDEYFRRTEEPASYVAEIMEIKA